ncbi:MAG: tetratricopeptide repeat protein [Gammaproteobacteria bacterium]|nr:tetratricopeptide repeat protein [Gammaproteobacteria bacterium]
MRHLFVLLLLVIPALTIAAPESNQQAEQNNKVVDGLDKPLYNPFVERYVLDEIKALRTNLQNQRAEFIERFTAAELGASDRAINYATSTVNNIFYIIAAAASILALVGWSSMREIRHKLSDVIEEKVSHISEDYEQRLVDLENKLKDRTNRIILAQEEITRTNTMHSLWMRAGIEATHQAKIDVYDQILNINPTDMEALAYKADEVLDMGEPQWAISLCNKALLIDEDYAYAYYQRACANSTLNNIDAAVEDLKRAIELSSTYIDEAKMDKSFINLIGIQVFDDLLSMDAIVSVNDK